MPIIGYLCVLGLFIGMIFFCFFWGVWELKKPKDPGPLFIDLDRTIQKGKRQRKRASENRTKKTSASEQSGRSREVSMLAHPKITTDYTNSNETIRVRGDLRIPQGEIIPDNLLVEGNLISQGDVIFQGGLHINGMAVIGARNRIEKSIVCQKGLLLLEDVIVNNCIDSEGVVFLKRGVRVGIGAEGGGIACASKIYLERAEGSLKIKSKKRVHIVRTMIDLIPEELRMIAEVQVK